MRRELTEFSDRIDEQFEPAVTITAETWLTVLNWFATPPAHKNKKPEPAHSTYVTQEGRLVAVDGLF